MGKPRGLPKTGGGSRKGRPNKLTKDLKDMILGALSDAGGQKYLRDRAMDSPAAFLSLVGKVLPMDVKADLSGRIEVTWLPPEQ